MSIRLAKVEEIPEGQGMIVRGPQGQEIALFKVNGEIFALDNFCPHQGGPLGEGQVTNHYVTCPWHAWDFDLRTGECLNMPGDDALSIPIIIQDGIVYLKE